MSALRFTFALVLASLAMPARAEGEEVCTRITREEYKIFHEYKDALADERVQKMKEKERKPKIAKNFGISVKALEAAIKKGEAVGAGLAKGCEAASRKSLEGTPVESRLLTLSVDDSAAHVVTYASWRVFKPADVEEEAALLAVRLANASPITSTVALWAEDDKGKKVFEGKIAADTAKNINEKRIPDFADSRFMKLFEDVKNSYAAENAGGE